MFNKNIELKWKDETFIVPVTMELIEEIDERFNLLELVTSMSNGKIKIAMSAKLVSIVLNTAGAKTSQEEVYKGMGGSGINMIAVTSMMSSIVAALLPASDEAIDDAKKKKVVTKKPSQRIKNIR